MRGTAPLRVALVLAALALGAGVGLLALAVHREGGASVPWGLVLACAASAAGSVGLQTLGAGPAVLTGYGAGWCLLVLTVLVGRPEGDYLVSGDARGWGFLLVASGSVLVATVVGVVTASARRPPGHGSRRRMSPP